ncbi:lactosylceramide 4-alpha-galactosyltransferase-like [Ceratina calcarata]|uniref:Lactosylceramide 4-alpha-galactosyltransferase-like n=1 Tax=Ceratina calcarata TaxID=156304 RepID=A0AAJ7N7G2_9HYME|nr:lactosylceramide 4-alpha-galactosyltransferase-like [Ceratina calcarata]
MLNVRQACAVESAAKMNPNMNVYLLLVSHSTNANQTRKFFDQLENYPNVRIRRVYLNKYMKDTPLEKWYEEGAWNKSHWPMSHMSDALRYLTLWRYGGIYLDLDVVVTTCLEDLTNFAGIQDSIVGAGAIGFSGSTLGRRVADICINDLRNNFRGDIWGHNGPGVITRMLENLCSTKNVWNMTIERCNGFELLPPSSFYPIHYSSWRKYFESQYKNSTMEAVKKARAIHVWNKLSMNEKVRVDSDVPYAIVARNYCPKVFNNCGEIF